MSQTGGVIFYTTNVDEASHLSFWYANYVIEESGRLRASSRLVRWLHTMGIAGGYINLLLDVASTLLIILCAKNVYRRLGFSTAEARVAAILTFILPVVFSSFNPVISYLDEIRLNSGLVRWISNPYNSEDLFLRSPEPQLSWLIIALVLSLSRSSRMATIVCLATSNLLYPFVKLPVIFVALANMLSKRTGILGAAAVTYIFIGLGTYLFARYWVEPSLTQFFVFSHLPVFSLTGSIGVILLALNRAHIPPPLMGFCATLVLSIWATENVQVLSGWLVTPVNYEQYWGVVVLAVISSVVLVKRGSGLGMWLCLLLLVFEAHCATLFRHNLEVYKSLRNPENILPVVRESPEKVACANIYLATYLDLAYPRREPTALSFTRTLHAASDRNYEVYACVKREIQSRPQSTRDTYARILEVLDHGYDVKGADLNVTMGRRDITRHYSLSTPLEMQCKETPLVLCGEFLDE
jgi:hypothetical protein